MHNNTRKTVTRNSLEIQEKGWGRTCKRRQARENACEAVTLVSVSLLFGRKNDTRFSNQSQSVVEQNQSKREITFDTQLKTALSLIIVMFNAL